MLVFVDCEGAMYIQEIRDLLHTNDITLHHFVPGTGHVSDPDDANFHSGDRRRYNKLVSSVNVVRKLSGNEKMEMLVQAYTGGTEEENREYIRHCGFFSDEKPAQIVSRLLSDWNRKAADKYEKYHRKQLEQYLWRRRMLGTKIHALPGRIGPWWDTIREFEFMD